MFSSVKLEGPVGGLPQHIVTPATRSSKCGCSLRLTLHTYRSMSPKKGSASKRHPSLGSCGRVDTRENAMTSNTRRSQLTRSPMPMTILQLTIAQRFTLLYDHLQPHICNVAMRSDMQRVLIPTIGHVRARQEERRPHWQTQPKLLK